MTPGATYTCSQPAAHPVSWQPWRDPGQLESPPRGPGPGAASAHAEVLGLGYSQHVAPSTPSVGVACEASGPAESEKQRVTFAASGT